MRPLLKEESFLPFQSIYCTAIDQDLDNANNCLSNCTLLHDHKFVEPLAAGRNEHDKMRKQIKDTWQRELKKMVCLSHQCYIYIYMTSNHNGFTNRVALGKVIILWFSL